MLDNSNYELNLVVKNVYITLINKKNCYKFVVCNFIFTFKLCSIIDVQYSNRTSIDKQ